jgi:hypothetical protein
MLVASGTAAAEVRHIVTPDAVQYGEGEAADGSASDAAITASEALQEPSSGSAEGGSPSSESSSADTIEASPVSEKEGYTGEAAREAGLTELPLTGGVSPASLLGGMLIAGGLLVRLARKVPNTTIR